MEPIEVREFRSRIGKAIRKLRDEEGISANYLAKTLGVTQPTISRIENGITSLSADRLCFLAKIFNRPFTYFIGEQRSIVYEADDILRAGLAFYGARQLKSKRTINVWEHYKTYADLLNSALNAASDARHAAAIAATLYQQAAKGTLEATRIITTIQNKRLIASLRSIINLIVDSQPHIQRPETEKVRVAQRILELKNELENEYGLDIGKSDIANISPDYVASFINESYQ